MNKFKGEIKQKSDWMSEYPIKYQQNTQNIRSGGTWYYCHRDTVGKCNEKYPKHKTSECQGTIQRKPIHSNTCEIQDKGIKKSKTLNIASALSSVIASDVEENEQKTCISIMKLIVMILHLIRNIPYT